MSMAMPDNLKAITEINIPQCYFEVQQFLGFSDASKQGYALLLRICTLNMKDK